MLNATLTPKSITPITIGLLCALSATVFSQQIEYVPEPYVACELNPSLVEANPSSRPPSIPCPAPSSCPDNPCPRAPSCPTVVAGYQQSNDSRCVRMCGENRVLTAFDNTISAAPIPVVGSAAPLPASTPTAYYLWEKHSWVDLATEFSNVQCSCDIGDDVYLTQDGERTTNSHDPLLNTVHRANGECTSVSVSYTPTPNDGCNARTTPAPSGFDTDHPLEPMVGITKEAYDTLVGTVGAHTLNARKDYLCRSKAPLPTAATNKLCPEDYYLLLQNNGDWACELREIEATTRNVSMGANNQNPTSVTFSVDVGDTVAWCDNGGTITNPGITMTVGNRYAQCGQATVDRYYNHTFYATTFDPRALGCLTAANTRNTQTTRCTGIAYSNTPHHPYGEWTRDFGTHAAAVTTQAEVNLAGHCADINQHECKPNTVVPAQAMQNVTIGGTTYTSMTACLLGEPSHRSPGGSITHCRTEAADTFAWETTNQQCLAGATYNSTTKLCDFYPLPGYNEPSWDTAQFTNVCGAGTWTVSPVFTTVSRPDGTTFDVRVGTKCFQDRGTTHYGKYLGEITHADAVIETCAPLAGTPAHATCLTTSATSAVSLTRTGLPTPAATITTTGVATFQLAATAQEVYTLTLPAASTDAWFYRPADTVRHSNQATRACGLGQLNRTSDWCYNSEYIEPVGYDPGKLPIVEFTTPSNTIQYFPDGTRIVL